MRTDCAVIYTHTQTGADLSLHLLVFKFSVIEKPCCCGPAPSLIKCHAAVFCRNSAAAGTRARGQASKVRSRDVTMPRRDGAAFRVDGECERTTQSPVSGKR